MFMLKDAGEKRTTQKFIDGKLLAEIEATYMSDAKGYVYMSAENNGIMLSTGNHLSGLALLNFSEFDKYPVSPFIQDDPEEENKPEFFKGQSPNIGFQLKGMALKGVQVINVTLHLFADDVESGDLNKFVKQFKAPTHVEVKYF